MRVRRVVTGHSPAGKAIVASDTEVESIELKALPDSSFVKLWGGDVVSMSTGTDDSRADLGAAIARYNTRLASDDRLITSVIPLRDGLAVAVKAG